MRNCWPHWAEFDNWAPVLFQSGEQLDENLLVHRRERVEVLDRNAFVYLVNGRIAGSELHDLRTRRRDETAI